MKLNTIDPNYDEIAFLKLIMRSKDVGDGWRNVSDTLIGHVNRFPQKELLEIRQNQVRLSARGEIVVEYI